MLTTWSSDAATTGNHYGEAPLMLVDEYVEQGMLGPQALKGSPVTLHLYVSDVDAAVSQAVAAGALLLLSSFQSFATTPETIGKAAKENVRREIIRETTIKPEDEIDQPPLF